MQRRLDRVSRKGAFVPSLWRLEIANSLQIAVRRGRCGDEHANASLGMLARLPITIDDETDLRAWGDTRRLARQHGLTVYDAAYLELALRRALPRMSSDAALVKAAGAAGVESTG